MAADEAERWGFFNRLATPVDRAEAIRAVLDQAPDEVRTFFRVKPDHSFVIPGALLCAVKPGA